MRFITRLALLIVVISALIYLADSRPAKDPTKKPPKKPAKKPPNPNKEVRGKGKTGLKTTKTPNPNKPTKKPTKKPPKPKKVERAKLEKYLNKYGYLKKLKGSEKGRNRTEKEMKIAVKRLQRMGGLKSSGDLEDSALVDLLDKSRCGMPDYGPTDVARRKRRYLLQGSEWQKRALTFRIMNRTPDLSADEVDTTMRNALAMWAQVVPLTFTEVKDGDADILIRFVTRDHGDDYPFDGPGGTLAHAFYPLDNKGISGDAHFDEEEMFTLKDPTNSGIDLYWTAVHEFGHSMGLAHSEHGDAVMYPYYQGYVPDFRLHYDDIQGMQYMYGSNTATEGTTAVLQTVTPHVQPTEGTGVPDKCTSSFDAFVQTKEGVTYAFKGAYFWPISDTGAWTGALKISTYWPLVEDSIDAAFYNDSFTYIFKGDKFWKFQNRMPVKPTAVAPLPITDPELNLPAEVAGMDAALKWARNGKIYFFKGSQYWRYDPYKRSMDIDYPKSIQAGWQESIPDNINSALQWENQVTYFFKDGEYYAIDDYLVKLKLEDPPYPRKTAHYWMGCSPEPFEGGKIAPVRKGSASGLLVNSALLLLGFLLIRLA